MVRRSIPLACAVAGLMSLGVATAVMAWAESEGAEPPAVSEAPAPAPPRADRGKLAIENPLKELVARSGSDASTRPVGSATATSTRVPPAEPAAVDVPQTPAAAAAPAAAASPVARNDAAPPKRRPPDVGKFSIESPVKALVASGDVQEALAGLADAPVEATRAAAQPASTAELSAVSDVQTTDNPAVPPGLVRWHPDLPAARAAADATGKPVLLFQMIGRLDQRFT